MRPTLASSPRITTETHLPSDQFDEWLVFNRPVTEADLGPVAPFVNYMLFSLSGRSWRGEQKVLHGRALSDEFWESLARLQPDAYVADGLRLTYVTCHPADHATVTTWLAGGDAPS